MSDTAGGAGAASGALRGSGAALIGSISRPGLVTSASFADQLRTWQADIERALAERLPGIELEPTRLHAAMRYSVLNGGRRVRPLLLYGAARAVGLGEAQVEGAACAIELMHAYSRVHDDLPAMDDDDLRRGKPTCHRAYDEGTAVLVGDALQSLAFQLLASDAALPPVAAIRLRLIELLAEAIGAAGKAGGQAIGVASHDRQMPVGEIEAMYALKTGALIRASVLMAAACSPETEPRLHEALVTFASSIGVAFQIREDLLALSSESVTSGQVIYPAASGLEAAQRRVDLLHAEALTALGPFGRAADPLRALTDWLLAA